MNRQSLIFSFILFCFLSFSEKKAFATGEPFPIGARSWAMGNATVALSDYNSFFNNPAGLGFLKENHINSSYHARHTIAGLQTISLSGNYNTKLVNIGIGLERFGDKLYNEQKLGLALGKSTNRVALGLKVSYFQAVIENISSKKTLLTEFGVQTKLSSKIQMGFHAYNLTGAKLYHSQAIPTVLKFGFSFTPTKQILLLTEAEKDLNLPMLLKAGLEYQLVKNFYLRTGITSRINLVHGGFGFQAKQFIFDYAINSHPNLGFSHHFSIGYNISKQEKARNTL